MSWIHRILGKDGATQMAVDAQHFSGRVTQRPMAIGAQGSYSVSLTTGVMAAAIGANSEIFQARWTHASKYALIRSVKLEVWENTTAFAAGIGKMALTIARAWSAQGTGGTGITFGTNDCKRKTSMAQTLFAANDVRIATTAALGAGTKTLDGQDFAAIGFGVSTAADAQYVAPSTYIWQRDTGDEWPLILVTNEGIVIRATMPATGTWGANIDMEWAEIDPAVYDGWT